MERPQNKELPYNSTVYIISPCLDEDWPLVWLVVVPFASPVISSFSHDCTVSSFHYKSQNCFKNRKFFTMFQQRMAYRNRNKNFCLFFFLFLLNLCGTQTSMWLTQTSQCKWISKLDLDIFSMAVIPWMV